MSGKIIVVGCGFSGAVIAREIAEKMNREVLIVEKRKHIAGNMYDEYDEHNILVQRYGPHVIVTDHWKVIQYLSQYSEMIKHTVKEISYIDGHYVRLPFNFETVQQLIGCEKAEWLLKKFRNFFAGRDRVPVLELVNHPDKDISAYGCLLFEKCYRTYCAKQWDIPLENLDTSIMDRVPMAMSYDERYMNKDFQYLPKNGFTKMFENMLHYPGINIRLGEDALNGLKLNENNHTITYYGVPVEILVFTGPVDELFMLKHGELPYRSLDIQYEWFECERKYPEKIISYPQAKGYTRRTEYKFMMLDSSRIKGTTIATEYPIPYTKNSSCAPFYPVITAQTRQIYSKYQKEALSYGNIFLCGRLAEFRYYNMDDCILNAFNVFEKIQNYLRTEM